MRVERGGRKNVLRKAGRLVLNSLSLNGERVVDFGGFYDKMARGKSQVRDLTLSTLFVIKNRTTQPLSIFFCDTSKVKRYGRLFFIVYMLYIFKIFRLIDTLYPWSEWEFLVGKYIPKPSAGALVSVFWAKFCVMKNVISCNKWGRLRCHLSILSISSGRKFCEGCPKMNFKGYSWPMWRACGYYKFQQAPYSLSMISSRN